MSEAEPHLDIELSLGPIELPGLADGVAGNFELVRFDLVHPVFVFVEPAHLVAADRIDLEMLAEHLGDKLFL